MSGTADRTAATWGLPCPALWNKLCRIQDSSPVGSLSLSPSPVAPVEATKPQVKWEVTESQTTMRAPHLPAGFCLHWLCPPAESCFLKNSDQGPFSSSPRFLTKQSCKSSTLQSYGIKHIYSSSAMSPFFALFPGAARPGDGTSGLSPSKLATGGTKPGVPE